jgi:hypothetical protein
MLANLTLWGNYDWMLFSDSETVWLAENVEAMLNKLDPAVPMFIAESFFPHTRGACVFPGHKPILHPTCTESPDVQPCTRHAIVDTEQDCAHTQGPGQVWSGGDWGNIISRGLMQAITKEQWQECVDCDEDLMGSHVCYGGGDVRVGECIFAHGYAPTLPDRDYTGINGQVRLGADVELWFATWQRAVEQQKCDPSVDYKLPLSLHVATVQNMRRLEQLYTAFKLLHC